MNSVEPRDALEKIKADVSQGFCGVWKRDSTPQHLHQGQKGDPEEATVCKGQPCHGEERRSSCCSPKTQLDQV